MKRGLWLAVILLVVAALVAAGWYLTRPKPVAVVLGHPDRGVVESTSTNTRAGTVTACRRSKLAPPTGGQITRLNVKKGERVLAGQVLLELWKEDVSAQLQLARNQLASARSHAEEACISADAAERDAGRSKQLREQGFVSEEVVDRAVSAANARRAGCDAARADIRQSESRISAAAAAKSRTVLRAPFAGVVADITGELGEFTTPFAGGVGIPGGEGVVNSPSSPVMSATTPAIDLIDDSCLYVTAPMDEVDAPRIVVGQAGRISVDALPGQKFDGRVRRIAPYVLDREKQARTVDVEVSFVDPTQFKVLLVGYSADVEIVLETRQNTLRVPTQALLEGNRLLVYRPDGTLEERRIEPGLANWQHTEVLSGLTENEQFVLSLERAGVKAGARVVRDPAVPDSVVPDPAVPKPSGQNSGK
jgi:HlyD family secretion protein